MDLSPMDVCDVENRIQIVSNTHTHTHAQIFVCPYIYLIIDRNIQYIYTI